MKVKKRWLLILALLVGLALACSLTPEQNQQVDQAAVDTMVAETIAASAPDQPDAQQPSATVDSGDQGQPPADPTATEALPTNTPEPSLTPTEEPSPTPEPTLPLGIDDLNLGGPDVLYEFNSKGSLYTFSSADSEAIVKDGTYQYTIFDAINYTIWTFPFSKVIEDYYYEVTITMPNNCKDKDRAGIIFGTPSGETDNGINFQISCDGNYRLWIYDGSDTIDLIKWKDSDELFSGAGKTNKIGVIHRNNKITLYINGTLVDQLSDDTYVGPGRIGFNIGVDDHDNVTFKFDNAAYWTNLP